MSIHISPQRKYMIGWVSSKGHSMFATVIGLLFMLQPAARLSSPNFEWAKRFWHPLGLDDVLAMRAWGVVFVFLGVACFFAFTNPKMRWVFAPLTAAYAAFAFSLLITADQNPALSFTGSVFTACVAFSVYNTATAVEDSGPRTTDRKRGSWMARFRSRREL